MLFFSTTYLAQGQIARPNVCDSSTYPHVSWTSPQSLLLLLLLLLHLAPRNTKDRQSSRGSTTFSRNSPSHGRAKGCKIKNRHCPMRRQQQMGRFQRTSRPFSRIYRPS